jgi:hypothetical protein
VCVDNPCGQLLVSAPAACLYLSFRPHAPRVQPHQEYTTPLSRQLSSAASSPGQRSCVPCAAPGGRGLPQVGVPRPPLCGRAPPGFCAVLGRRPAQVGGGLGCVQLQLVSARVQQLSSAGTAASAVLGTRAPVLRPKEAVSSAPGGPWSGRMCQGARCSSHRSCPVVYTNTN